MEAERDTTSKIDPIEEEPAVVEEIAVEAPAVEVEADSAAAPVKAERDTTSKIDPRE